MEFLESLYNIENFGIYLFVVIGILVVLFLIILFFGKKDEKKRKEEMKQNDTVSFKENTPSVPLEIPAVEPEKIVEDTPVEEDFSSLPMQDSSLEKEFDFDALAEAISKELESIEPKKVETKEYEEEPRKPILEEKDEEPLHYQVFEPAPESYPQEEEKIEEDSRIEEPVVQTNNVSDENKVKPVMPTVFSSVYVNRDKEEKAPVVEEVKEEVKPIVTPKIELPKMIDLPKKK